MYDYDTKWQNTVASCLNVLNYKKLIPQESSLTREPGEEMAIHFPSTLLLRMIARQSIVDFLIVWDCDVAFIKKKIRI